MVAATTRTSTRMSTDAADALEGLLLEKPQQLGLQRPAPSRRSRRGTPCRRRPISNSPRFWRSAPVKAPRSCPNSSLSSSASGSAEQVMFMNGRDGRGRCCSGAPWPRGPCRCRSRRSAARSTPGSPRLSAAAPCTPTIAGLSPTMRSKLYGCAWRRAQRPHFAPQLRRLERLLDEQRDLVEVERLVRVVIRAVLHRLDRDVDARDARSAG